MGLAICHIAGKPGTRNPSTKLVILGESVTKRLTWSVGIVHPVRHDLPYFFGEFPVQQSIQTNQRSHWGHFRPPVNEIATSPLGIIVKRLTFAIKRPDDTSVVWCLA